jgi:hypothetical protein
MTSKADLSAKVAKEISSPETTSLNRKSGAEVPKANIVEGVNTINKLLILVRF